MAVDDQGNAIRFNGTSWSKPTPIDSQAMTAVSCPTAQFCVAGDINGAVLVFHGGSWSKPKVIDPASADQLDVFGINGITSVSCASAKFCMAADVLGKVMIRTAGRWSAPRRIESRSLYKVDRFNLVAAIVGVSCPSPSFCAAATVFGRASTWDGTSWAPAQLLTSPRATVVDESHGLPVIAGISCTSATFCVAVDPSGDAHTYDGTAWSRARSIDPSSAHQGNRDGLTAVSCPSPTFCTAVDDLGRALTYDGSAWSEPQPVDPTLGLSTVSCPTSRFCVALNDLGDALVYDGTSWSSPQTIDR